MLPLMAQNERRTNNEPLHYRVLSIFYLGAGLTVNAQSGKGTRLMNPSRTRANSKIIVQSSEARLYETVSPKLVEIQISEKFSGDIDGDSPARALQVQRDDKSASMVSMQRFSGTLNGRHGAFVLQGTETVENGRINATWFVVPGSGTGDLRGLRGEGGFKGDFGKGSDGWLDYWFE
jgi:hypothetical protein